MDFEDINDFSTLYEYLTSECTYKEDLIELLHITTNYSYSKQYCELMLQENNFNFLKTYKLLLETQFKQTLNN